MIKNDRQYKLSKAQMREFEAALTSLKDAQLPPGIDPDLVKIQQNALRSQLEELAAEIQEYEAIRSGRVTSFEANSLDDLPSMLIRARIARGINHKELADKLGIKEQQVQRWEANDYSGASIDNLKAVANALGVVSTQRIFIPKADVTPKSFFQFLAIGIGLSQDFIIKRILSDDIADAFREGRATHDVIVHSAAAIAKVLGINTEDLLELKLPQCDFPVLAATRFKLPARANRSAVSGYTLYAHYLAGLLVQCVISKPTRALPATPHEFFVAVSEPQGPMTFERVVKFLWDCGVLVLPLSDAGGFHGAVWKIGDTFVIALKQSTPLESRWLYDALHESGHIHNGDVNDDVSLIESSEISPDSVGAEEEAANEWAEDVLFDSSADRIEEACTSGCGGNLRYLKAALPTIAEEFNVNLGALANYMAHRLAQEKMNWWGAAHNLQSCGRKPIQIAREIVFERINLFWLSKFDRMLLQKALAEE